MDNQCQAREIVSKAIYAALASHEMGAAARWAKIYKEPINDSVTEQIRSANIFWRLQLGAVQHNTIDVRECLIDDIDFDDWLRLFCTHVIPAIVCFNLPMERMVSDTTTF